jgi:hypothetical protein
VLTGDKAFKPGTPCWICGFKIQGKRKEVPLNGYTVECEHVFPIAQAVFFIDLFRGSSEPSLFPKKVLELE